MNINLEVEMLDNGIVLRTENDCAEAVLYGDDGVNEFSDCSKAFGEIVLEPLLIDSDEESKERYEKEGKPTYGYRFDIKVTPLAKGEFKF